MSPSSCETRIPPGPATQVFCKAPRRLGGRKGDSVSFERRGAGLLQAGRDSAAAAGGGVPGRSWLSPSEGVGLSWLGRLRGGVAGPLGNRFLAGGTRVGGRDPPSALRTAWLFPSRPDGAPSGCATKGSEEEKLLAPRRGAQFRGTNGPQPKCRSTILRGEG